MAVIFKDGFDWYQGSMVTGVLAGGLAKRWTDGVSSGAVTGVIGAAYARSPSGQGIRIARGNNLGGIYKAFGTNYVSGLIGFAIQAETTWASWTAPMCAAYDGTTEQISIRTNASSQLTICRGATVLATGTTVLTTGTWYYIELKFTIHNSAGVVELHLNGVSEIASTTGLDTQNTANTQFNAVFLGIPNVNLVAGWFDDLYVLNTASGTNTDWLGPVRVVAQYAAANGNHADWTPNGGSNMGAISEPYEDSDISFNQSATANDIDTFVMQDLPSAAGSVYATSVLAVARQDAGAARSVAPVLRIGGTDYVGSTKGLSSSYQYLEQIYDQSPATASAWTISEINGLEAGYKLIA